MKDVRCSECGVMIQKVIRSACGGLRLTPMLGVRHDSYCSKARKYKIQINDWCKDGNNK